jgi:long-chain acyl-CoA synthetase
VTNHATHPIYRLYFTWGNVIKTNAGKIKLTQSGFNDTIHFLKIHKHREAGKMIVNDFLQKSAREYPDKTALVCGSQRFTYAEIDEKANQLAHALIHHGVQRSDRVVIYLDNSVETVIAVFAILKASAVFVIINPTTKEDKLCYILNNARATALITAGKNRNLAQDLPSRVPSLQFSILCQAKSPGEPGESMYDFNDLLCSFPPDRPSCQTIDQDLACLIYTSGSTGDPKGVMSSHRNVVFVSKSIMTFLENRVDDIVINVLPLSFDYGLYQLLMVFRFGGTLILEKSFAYLAKTLKIMEKEKVTGFPGVPTLFAMILQMNLDPYDLGNLRYITNTAAALPPDHILQIKEKFPHATLYSMYGLTECKRTTYLPPEELSRRPDSVGIPIPGTEVWIEDEEGNRLGPNVVGELVIRGSHVMRGYWKNPEATQRVYKPGPFPGEHILYSGDLFKMDSGGFLYFIARKDDIIKSRGEKVSPREIENVLYSIKGVSEAAVIGIKDTMLGQAIKAFVVVRDKQIDKNYILRYCKEHLENFMVPKYIEIRNSLPKTGSGKIKKTGLE